MVTETKKLTRSPQSLEWALVLPFADAEAGLWYIKATSVCSQLSAFTSASCQNRKGSGRPRVPEPCPETY